MNIPQPFPEYVVPGVGSVVDHQADTYVVRMTDGRICGFRSPSGTPSQGLAAAEIAAAIANPPPPPIAVGVWTTLTFLGRFTDPEKAAVFTSPDVDVIVARSLGLAAQEIRTDDPRTQALMSLLVAKGLLTEARKTVILTP